jgi:hypothetical protein
MTSTISKFAAFLGMTAGMAGAAWAADAQTSATVSPGAAAATAHYTGERGFARTDTRTGRVDLARGVAVGVDERGLSLSVSHALRPSGGPAIATTFNLAIGPEGVAGSSGVALADGPRYSQASAGGQASTGHASPTATVIAHGVTDPAGQVRVQTRSDSHRGLIARPAVEHRRVITQPPLRLAERARMVESKHGYRR